MLCVKHLAGAWHIISARLMFTVSSRDKASSFPGADLRTLGL